MFINIINTQDYWRTVNNGLYWTVKRIIGGCDFGVLLYLLTQLIYVVLQDGFTMFAGKPMGAVLKYVALPK